MSHSFATHGPMDCSLVSFIHGFSRHENTWIAISFFRPSPDPGKNLCLLQVSLYCRQILPPGKPIVIKMKYYFMGKALGFTEVTFMVRQGLVGILVKEKSILSFFPLHSSPLHNFFYFYSFISPSIFSSFFFFFSFLLHFPYLLLSSLLGVDNIRPVLTNGA